MTTIDDAVDLCRKRHGWTLEQVAGQLGVSLHTVRQWLKPETSGNHREAPGWAILALLSLYDGRPRSERRGALTVTYAPATGRGRL